MDLEKSGNKKEAIKIFKEMTENQIQGLGYLMIALGHKGLGEDESAAEYFKKALAVDVNQLWSAVYFTSL